MPQKRHRIIILYTVRPNTDLPEFEPLDELVPVVEFVWITNVKKWLVKEGFR